MGENYINYMRPNTERRIFMKKTLIFAVVAAMLLSLCACGGNGDAETSAKATDAATVAGTEAAGTTAGTAGADDETGAANPDVTLAEGETSEDTVGEDEDDDEPSGNYEYDSESLWPVYIMENGELVPTDVTPDNMNASAQTINPGDSYATKFTVNEGWIYSALCRCPSWGDSIGTLQVDIFEWVEVEKTEDMTDRKWLKACYEETLASTPIYSKVEEDFADNAELGFTGENDDDKTLSAGKTYLFVLSNPLDVNPEGGQCGVYCTPSNLTRDPLVEGNNKYVSDVVSFKNGNQTNYIYMLLALEMTFNEGTLGE